VSVLVALGTASSALAQYLYLDVNGDGLNFDREAVVGNLVSPDGLSPAVTSVDVYLVTDHLQDGSVATCASEEPFTIGSYEVVLRSTTNHGGVFFQGWTDAMGFEIPIIAGGDGTFVTGGTDAWFGRGSSSSDLPPGTYKLGAVSIVVTGFPTIFFGTSTALNGNAVTAFGSECDGVRRDGRLYLGPFLGDSSDFAASFGSTEATGVVSTTWGRIKERYR
jgi:hypothetical protein